MERVGGITDNFQDCVTRLHVQARTLPYKARAGHCYVEGWSQSQRTLTKISCSEIWYLPLIFRNQIEIESKMIGSLWLLSKEVQ